MTSAPPSVDAAIDVAGLVKTFGATRALDSLDLQVRTGEIHGFFGPNGSGKSTTIRVLLGLLRADSGMARLLGATRGPMPSSFTAVWRMCPATSTCGPTSRVAR